MNEPDLRAEIVRLNKIVLALMNRVESSTNIGGDDFSMFQTTIMFEEQVRQRTEELDAAMRTNEKILRDLRESEAKFHDLVDQSLVGIAIVMDGKFIYPNPKLASIFGYTVEELLQMELIDVIVENERPIMTENIRKGLRGERKNTPFIYLGLRKDGTHVHIEVVSFPMRVSEKPALIVVLTDISERVNAQTEILNLNAQLKEMVNHDTLTGLFNRRYMEETFERELIRAKRQNYPVSVIMSDLDHFKVVNDTFGHLAGDEVLRAIGRLMKLFVRGSDIYCRYGGEEFLLILPGMKEETACERAEQLRTAIAASPIIFGTSAIRVSASFGVVTFPQHGKTCDELIAVVDNALYKAKKSGRNQVRRCGEAPPSVCTTPGG